MGYDPGFLFSAYQAEKSPINNGNRFIYLHWEGGFCKTQFSLATRFIYTPQDNHFLIYNVLRCHAMDLYSFPENFFFLEAGLLGQTSKGAA